MQLEEFEYFKLAKKTKPSTWVWEKHLTSSIWIEYFGGPDQWAVSVGGGGHIIFWSDNTITGVGQIAADPAWPRSIEEALSVIEMDEASFLKMGFA